MSGTIRRSCKIFVSLACSVAACLMLSPSAYAVDSSNAATRQSPYPQYPTIDYNKVKNPQLVRKGEYLVKASDCIACHTPEHSNKVFGGGLEFKTPFGSLFSPNITSDDKNGIGKWTEKQFAKALRQGVSPSGSFYYPAFPYRNYNYFTDDDANAIYAYLRAIPKLDVPNKKDDMMFPFNWRFLQLGWRMLFFYFQKEGSYKPDHTKSAMWNRGKYLVVGPGHCDMCHTKSYYILKPKYTLAAPIRKYNLAGAKVIGGYRAPNITSTLMKDVPLAKIADVFLKDELVEGGKVAQKPMLEVNHDSLSYLQLKDLESIGAYLKTVKSKIPPMDTSGGSAGESIYETYCSGCHTTGAGGAPKLGDKAAWDPLIKQGLNDLYANATKGIGGMPAKGTCSSCTADQIKEVVDYIVNQAKAGTAGSSGATVKPMKQLTLADGKQIYEKHCAVCHTPGKPYLNAPALGDKAAWAPRIKQGMAVLIEHTFNGYGNKTARSSCAKCSDAQLIAAAKYMVNQSKSSGNYQLW